jgi:hypothetical protein
MNSCLFTNTNGLAKDCEAFLAAVKGIAVANPSQSFATLAAAKTLENWREAIQEDLTISFFRPLRSTEITDPEPVTETDGFGSNMTTAFNAPMMVAYMSANPCDWHDLVANMNGIRRVYLFNEDGAKMATLNKSGVVKGFEAQVAVRPLSAKGRENQLQQYAVYVNFTNLDEFKKMVVWDDGNEYTDYLDYMPAGYTVEITSALSGASATVKLYARCNPTLLGTDTFTAESVDVGNCANPSVTVGAITAGSSVLTVYSTGTTPLTTAQ